MLCNQSRAISVLDAEGYDGLIGHTPINQYYLSDYWGLFNSAGGYDGAYFSLFSARNPQDSGLVIPALELRRLETTGGSWLPNLYSYFTDSEMELPATLADGTPRGRDYIGWKPVPDAALTGLEQRWVNRVTEQGQQMSPNGFWALARAVLGAGLGRGRLAVDDLRIGGWLNACGLDGLQCDYRPDLFNRIRQVKTTEELAIMRQAATINENGLLAAAAAVREGAEWPEIQIVYMVEMARQGGRGIYVLCGLGELPAGKVRRGEPVMLDALGQYRFYHGDFGRCAVAGEPSAKHRRYHQAICNGWEAAQPWLKPGVRFSELATAVAAAVRQSGIRDFREPVVHSLGLEHTDDPKPPGVMPQTKEDQVLEENMVINIDLPHTEIGWGSVHMEDTLVITRDGYDRLTSAGFDLIVNP